MARRWLAGVAAATLLLNGGIAAATSMPLPGPEETPAVARVTTLRGDSSTTMRVRVPGDAVVDLTAVERNGEMWPKALRATGGRGYVGFLLTRRGTAEGLFVVGARLPRPLNDGSTVTRAVGYGQPAVEDRSSSSLPAPLGQPTSASCTRCRVPAGDYRLQLITMGKPAKVEITFEGLRGRTTLRPSALTTPFGFTGGFRAHRDAALSDGGGMGMGMGWWGRESGVLLTTYQLDVTPERLPIAQADASSCRSVGREESCTGRRLSAGTTPSMAGFGASGGDKVKEVSTSLDFGTMGFATWTARTSMLWIPIRSPARDSFGIELEAGAGTQATGTQVFR